MPPKPRKSRRAPQHRRFEQSLAETAASLARTADRQSGMIERLFSAVNTLLGREPQPSPEDPPSTEAPPVEPPQARKWQRLTRRELEVGRLLLIGRDNEAIADELTLSPNTVRNHRSSIYTKLNVHNLEELTAYSHFFFAEDTSKPD